LRVESGDDLTLKPLIALDDGFPFITSPHPREHFEQDNGGIERNYVRVG
jgi:hypothetical protein